MTHSEQHNAWNVVHFPYFRCDSVYGGYCAVVYKDPG